MLGDKFLCFLRCFKIVDQFYLAILTAKIRTNFLITFDRIF